MDQQIEKDLEKEISDNSEYKRIAERVANILKRYDVQKYDENGINLLQFTRAAKQYGIEFVESVIETSIEKYPNAPMKLKITLLPGQLKTAVKGMQRVTFTAIYEGPVFSHKQKDAPEKEEIRGKSVVVMIDNELYVIIAKKDKVEMPFLPYHKYLVYGNFTNKNNDKNFYLNSDLPVTDVGETSVEVNLEEMMSFGRPVIYQYSDLVELMSRNTQVSFFVKAFVEKVEEKKGVLSAYLVIPSGYDLPQDRPISLLVNNDIAEGDQLYIVGSVNQQNTWNDEIQLVAKIVLPIHGTLDYSMNKVESAKETKPTSKEESTSITETKTKQAEVVGTIPSKDKETPKSEDARINSILKNTMSSEEEDEFYG